MRLIRLALTRLQIHVRPQTVRLFIEASVAKAKAEIRADVKVGTVPDYVSSFSELGDYVDHNEYGGLCSLTAQQIVDLCPLPLRPTKHELEARYHVPTFIDICNVIQGRVDAWIKVGGLLG